MAHRFNALVHVRRMLKSLWLTPRKKWRAGEPLPLLLNCLLLFSRVFLGEEKESKRWVGDDTQRGRIERESEREKEREREREREKDGCLVTSSMCVSMCLSGREVCVDSGESLGRSRDMELVGWLLEIVVSSKFVLS